MTRVEEATVPGSVPVSARVAIGISLVMGFTGVAFWIPALFGPASGAAQATDHPAAIIQRVASLALQQYTPSMQWLIPILGGVFSLASCAQIVAALGALGGRGWGPMLLRSVAYCKIGLYVASGLLLGLAIFSVQSGNPSWGFSVANWVANLAMIAIYYWIARAMAPLIPAPDTTLDDEDDRSGLVFEEDADEPARVL